MFNTVLQFATFSQAQMIFLSILMLTLAVASLRLRSLVGLATWALAGITLIGVMTFNLEIIYFWFMVILTFIGLTIAMSVQVYYSTNV